MKELNLTPIEDFITEDLVQKEPQQEWSLMLMPMLSYWESVLRRNAKGLALHRNS